MGRRGKQTGDAWKMWDWDMPGTRAQVIVQGKFDGLEENAVFRWLTRAKKEGLLARIIDNRLCHFGLLWPSILIMLDKVSGIGFLETPYFYFLIACLLISAILIISNYVRELMIPPGQRSAVMRLPRDLVDELTMTKLTAREVVTGIWAYEARKQRDRLEVRVSILFLALLTILGLTVLGFITTPLLLWILARWEFRWKAYPFHKLKRMHRILKRQHAERNYGWRYYWIIKDQLLFGLIPWLAGLIGWVAFITIILGMFSTLIYSGLPLIIINIVILVIVLAFGLGYGYIEANHMMSNREDRLEKMVDLVEKLLAHRDGIPAQSKRERRGS